MDSSPASSPSSKQPQSDEGSSAPEVDSPVFRPTVPRSLRRPLPSFPCLLLQSPRQRLALSSSSGGPSDEEKEPAFASAISLAEDEPSEAVREPSSLSHEKARPEAKDRKGKDKNKEGAASGSGSGVEFDSPKSSSSWDAVTSSEAIGGLSIGERLEIPPGTPPSPQISGGEGASGAAAESSESAGRGLRFDDQAAVYLPEEETWRFEWRYTDWQVPGFDGPMLHEMYDFEVKYPWMAPAVRYLRRYYYPGGGGGVVLPRNHPAVSAAAASSTERRAREVYGSAVEALAKAIETGRIVADEVTEATGALREMVTGKWPDWGDTVVEMLKEAVDASARRNGRNRYMVV
ncbi:hypothetical protein N3K66_005861 [Trichothecium roseum]|uniref:Uncharacterized protein n=1 Tax=Trichothecium roseum TaxID=47278 RepID=A0ACC0V0W1_9HYPO|nr:hypothetical protein N3K66_005861 [Trichothecium roseum]